MHATPVHTCISSANVGQDCEQTACFTVVCNLAASVQARVHACLSHTGMQLPHAAPPCDQSQTALARSYVLSTRMFLPPPSQLPAVPPGLGFRQGDMDVVLHKP